MKRKSINIFKTKRFSLLILSPLILPLMLSFFRKEEKKLPQVIVKRGVILSYVEETGIIKERVGAMVKVGTRVTGTLFKLKYQIGDYVKKGELIAQIDDREIKAEIEATKSSLEYEKENLRFIKNTYPLKIKEKEAEVLANREKYLYAKLNYERERKLLLKNFTTKDSVDRAKKDMEVAKANLSLSKKALVRLKKEYESKIRLSEKRIKEISERLKAYQVRLSYTKIYAPISGYVAQVSTQQGETVVAGLTAPNLITIVDPSLLEVHVYVDETDIGKVKKGQKAVFWVDAYPDKRFFGKIEEIYPKPEIKENVVYYIAVIKINKEYTKFLKPEMTAHVKILIKKKENVLLVPLSFIVYRGGRAGVYILSGKKVIFKEIELGEKGESEAEVLKGLKEGDRIVLKHTK